MSQVPNFFETKQAGVSEWISGLGTGIGDAFNVITGSGAQPMQIEGPMQERLSNAASNQSLQTALNWFLGAAGVGGGIAGISALLKRFKKPSEEEELESIRKSTGPILQLKRAQTTPTDVAWRGPAIFAGAAGGSVLGYMLLKKLLAVRESKELEDRRTRAEQSYTEAISGALEPKGLELTAKGASIQNMSDEEVLMSALHEIAMEKVASIKKRAYWGETTLNKLGWWSLLLGAPIAGLGATAGWNMGAAKNPHAKEIRDIERRHLLKLVNAPASPILTVLESRKQQRKKKDDEEDGEITVNE